MTLFDTLAAKATQAAINRAFAKGLLRCPECGAKPAAAPTDMDAMVRCVSCGFSALPDGWRPESQTARAVDPDDVPAGTRIRRERTMMGERVWHIPASGKFGFFLFFGLFWTAIIAMVSGAFLFGKSSEGSEESPWFIYPFLSVFWAIGIGMLYAALRNKYARHQITVTQDRVTLRREMFGRVKQKSLVTSQVDSVAQVEFYQQNYQPVYGVEIRGTGGKLRFGTTLREEEKAWLVADIKRAVFGETEASPIAARTPEMIVAQRQSSFSFPLPPSPKHLWITGAIFLLVGPVVISIAITKGSGFGAAVLIPIIFGLVFSGVGAMMVRMSWQGRSREVRLEGDDTQVALRTYQHGRVIKEQSFSRAAVSEVRATGVGHVNGKPIKRIDLIVDGKAHRISRWTEGDAADVWTGDVCRALGR